MAGFKMQTGEKNEGIDSSHIEHVEIKSCKRRKSLSMLLSQTLIRSFLFKV